MRRVLVGVRAIERSVPSNCNPRDILSVGNCLGQILFYPLILGRSRSVWVLGAKHGPVDVPKIVTVPKVAVAS
jgi:hypothetical protein